MGSSKKRPFARLSPNQKAIVRAQMNAEGLDAANPRCKYRFRNLSPDSIRSNFTPEFGVAKITDSIEKSGYNNKFPVLVYPAPKGKFDLFGGYHRYTSVKNLQKMGKLGSNFKIPSIVISYE